MYQIWRFEMLEFERWLNEEIKLNVQEDGAYAFKNCLFFSIGVGWGVGSSAFGSDREKLLPLDAGGTICYSTTTPGTTGHANQGPGIYGFS
jgi:hypothetical protein